MPRKRTQFNYSFSASILGEMYSIMIVSESPTTIGVACSQFPTKRGSNGYLDTVAHDGTKQGAEAAAIAVISRLVFEAQEEFQDALQGIYEGVRGNIAPTLYEQGQLVRAEARERAKAAETIRQALVKNLSSYTQRTRVSVLTLLGVPADVAATATVSFADMGEILLQQEIENQIENENQQYVQ